MRFRTTERGRGADMSGPQLPIAQVEIEGVMEDWTPDGIMDAMEEGCVSEFARSGVVMPRAFLIVENHPKLGRDGKQYMATVIPVMIKGLGFPPGLLIAYAEVVRATAQKMDAVAVVTTAEIWSLGIGDPTPDREKRLIDEAQAWRDAHDGTLQGHPDTVEMVHIGAEFARMPTFNSSANILRETKSPTLAQWSRAQVTNEHGRLTGLLPASAHVDVTWGGGRAAVGEA